MRDFDEMERKVSSDRARLSASLEALHAVVNPEAVTRQVSETARSAGGELGVQAWSAARANPAAFALVGTGLALLLTGAGTRSDNDAAIAKSAHPRRPDSKTVSPKEAMAGFDARVEQAQDQMNEEMTGMIDDPSPRAERLRAALDRGLDRLPSAARTRVVNARRAALAAQERVEKHADRAAAKARGFHEEQPLAAGALALGFGALLGALLPSTRREDALLGRERDALMRRAQETFHAEMDKLADVAKSKLEDAAPTSGTVPSKSADQMATQPPRTV